MFGKGDVEGVFLSKRDVGRLQTAGVAWAIEERGDHRVLSEASGTCVFLDPRTKGCGIYDVRPTQCRNFLCLLFIHPRAPNLIGLRSAGTMPA